MANGACSQQAPSVLAIFFVDTPGGVSVMTAEAHRANLMHKMNLHTVSGLIRYAIRHKVVEA